MFLLKSLLLSLVFVFACALPNPYTTKPTIVIVPGAWHSPQHYALLTGLLEQAGYDVVCQRLPSVGSSTPKTATTAQDADFVRNSLLLPLIKKGKSVVVYTHSYGGIPGAAAAFGLSKRELSTVTGNTGGGVVGLIFQSAFLIPDGTSLKENSPGQQYPSWVIVNATSGQASAFQPEIHFYADVNPVLRKLAIKLILPEAEHALSTPTGPPAWSQAAFDGQRGYIYTLQDQALVLPAQQGMVAGSGVTWAETSLNSSHSPFLSEPEKLAAAVNNLINGFSS